MKIKICCLLIVMCMFMELSVITFANTYVNVSEPSIWAVDEVNAAKNIGLVTDSVMKDYQADITREQFCEMVVKVYEKISGKIASVGTKSFTDTSNREILKYC